MLDKNTKANLAIEATFWKKLLAFIIMAMGIVYPFQDIRAIIITAIYWVIAAFIMYRAMQVSKAIDLLQEYGPLIINHPEYTFADYCKNFRRDRDIIIKDLELMKKKKILFGQIDTFNNRFIIDEDYNLRYLLKKKKWDSAIF